MKLLQSFDVFEPEVITESVMETDGTERQRIILKGIIQKADTLNQNGRVYPKSVLEREIRNYQKFISEERALGELDHPAESVVSLKNVSHIMREAYFEGNVVRGTIELLNTPSGKIAQELIKAKVKLGISSRGVGSTEKRGDVTYVNDYNLITFDLVNDPSTPGAFLSENRIISLDDYKKTFTRSDVISRLCNDVLALKK
jgi:hypothetical protein